MYTTSHSKNRSAIKFLFLNPLKQSYISVPNSIWYPLSLYKMEVGRDSSTVRCTMCDFHDFGLT